MRDGSSPGVNLGLALFVIAGAIIFFIETLRLPEGIYEPLGSAPVPQAVSLVVLALAAWMAIAACRELARRHPGQDMAPAFDFRRHALRPVLVIGMTFLYVLVMQAALMGFGLATTFFLFAAITVLQRPSPATLLAAALLAAIAGFGGQWLFTQVLIIDLPV